MHYILHHAQDRLIFVDLSLVPLIEALADDLPDGCRVVVMCDADHMPDTSFDALCYETLLEAESPDIDWPDFPETTAAGLCYTSGTTGNPKGALYSHRSVVLHALMVVAGHPRSLMAGQQGAACRAALSRQRLGHALYSAACRDEPCHAGAASGWGKPL
jgi:acyl-CoA synthetase (AMP-forming)/AMP-acid ligase II